MCLPNSGRGRGIQYSSCYFPVLSLTAPLIVLKCRYSVRGSEAETASNHVHFAETLNAQMGHNIGASFWAERRHFWVNCFTGICTSGFDILYTLLEETLVCWLWLWNIGTPIEDPSGATCSNLLLSCTYWRLKWSGFADLPTTMSTSTCSNTSDTHFDQLIYCLRLC